MGKLVAWIIGIAAVLYIGGAFDGHESAHHGVTPSLEYAQPAPAQEVTPAPAVVPPGGLYFKGDECTIDCSGHEAGYRWAEENLIDDPDSCDGNSESFIEGCKAYAREQSGDGSDSSEE